MQDFIDDLRKIIDQAEADGVDMQRVAAMYDVHMRSTKAVSSADLVVSVSSEGERVIVKKTDPNQSHPYNATELMTRVNAKREGRKLTSHDYQALCWKEDLRNNSRMAWKHKKGLSHNWSGDAVKHMANLSDTYYDKVRVEYREYLRSKRKKN